MLAETMRVADDERLLRLAPDDNVCLARVALTARESIVVGGASVLMEHDIDAGHKLAARDIEAGEKVVRFGTPIGSATRPICRGEWVHTHNLKSDYLPTIDHRGGDEADPGLPAE
jgi:altronate dehydratase small subunit